MLPSFDMNRNDPAKSLHNTPLCLSANVPKQKTLAMKRLSSSPPIRFGIPGLCITGGMGRKASGSGKGMMGIGWSTVFFGLELVLLIP